MTSESAQFPPADASTTLQSHLIVARPQRGESDPRATEASPEISDPVALFRHLEASGRFHRDTGFGRIFHPGKVSFRENQPHDSLHIVVHHNHVSGHVDRVSPLGLKPDSPTRYSLRRAAAHNVAGMAQDLVRLLRGRQGDHRSHLDCEWVWDPAESTPDEADLLDPRAAGWSVQLEARVAGSLDEPRLRAALSAVLGPHAVHDPLAVVDCPDDAALDAARAELQSTVVPVHEWPPLRARLARHPAGDVLMLNLNHAATDGFGAVHVLKSIARAYAGKEELRPPLDFLTAHDLPVRPASAPVSKAMAGYRRLVERVRDGLARPARLAPDQQDDDDPGHGFHLVTLSPDDTQLAADPERPGTGRNILMAALHLAIGDWNLQHGTPGRRVGVLVPVNLRHPEWREDTIGNMSVTARVSTSRRHRAGRETALKAVTAQTTRNKRTRTGIALIAALDRNGLLPLWAKQSLVVLQPLTRNRYVDTAMLSNLGRLDDPPSFGAETGETVEMWLSTPARSPAALCVGAVTIGGRMHVCFRYPKNLFSADAARRFADCYLAHVRVVAYNRAKPVRPPNPEEVPIDRR